MSSKLQLQRRNQNYTLVVSQLIIVIVDISNWLIIRVPKNRGDTEIPYTLPIAE